MCKKHKYAIRVEYNILITTGCSSNEDCSGMTDRCTAGQCMCGTNDMCANVWDGNQWNDKICSLGRCIGA